MGWQRIIPTEVLECFEYGVFGMHGSSRNCLMDGQVTDELVN